MEHELLSFFDSFFDSIDEIRTTRADVRSEHVTPVTLPFGSDEDKLPEFHPGCENIYLVVNS